VVLMLNLPAHKIVSGETVPWDKEPTLEDDGPVEDADDGSLPETEMSQISTDVEEVVQCLFRRPVSFPSFSDDSEPSTTRPIQTVLSRTDASHFEPFDIQHVRARFPKTPDDLAQRLGKGISQRRQYFNYRNLHHRKVSQGIEFGEDITEAGIESTVASSILKEMKACRGGKDTSYIDEDAYSSDDASNTSYASSTAKSGPRKIPPLPKESAYGQFECPFCFMMISASTTIAWR
jgi:hypothetical protein